MLRVWECKAYITSDMWGVHVAFLGTRKQHREEIKTAGVVGVSIKRPSNHHIPGVVGRTTCSSHLCSGLLTIS